MVCILLCRLCRSVWDVFCRQCPLTHPRQSHTDCFWSVGLVFGACAKQILFTLPNFLSRERKKQERDIMAVELGSGRKQITEKCLSSAWMLITNFSLRRLQRRYCFIRNTMQQTFSLCACFCVLVLACNCDGWDGWMGTVGEYENC